MRGTLSCFLAFIYLLVAITPMQIREELDKLPQLVEHFQQHQLDEAGLTFSKFWSLHYGTGFTKHANSHDHSELPGKSNHHHVLSCSCSIMALPATAVAVVLFPPTEADHSATHVALPLLPSSHLSEIWQPPRS
ncbi:MAG: hypothetical protein IPL65_07700 [Lewinellaceae bacterium]|nr:hypothetical protein [Lewinellaceae bacterium]